MKAQPLAYAWQLVPAGWAGLRWAEFATGTGQSEAPPQASILRYFAVVA